MNKTASVFIAKSTIKASNLDHRRKINFNMSKYNAAVPQGKAQFDDLPAARRHAAHAQSRALRAGAGTAALHPAAEVALPDRAAQGQRRADSRALMKLLRNSGRVLGTI